MFLLRRLTSWAATPPAAMLARRTLEMAPEGAAEGLVALIADRCGDPEGLELQGAQEARGGGEALRLDVVAQGDAERPVEEGGEVVVAHSAAGAHAGRVQPGIEEMAMDVGERPRHLRRRLRAVAPVRMRDTPFALSKRRFEEPIVGSQRVSTLSQGSEVLVKSLIEELQLEAVS
jgi:hypothetical protein